MEFGHVGAHCALEECRQLDFLPWTCEACGLSFCLKHKEPQQHQCAVADNPHAQSSLPPSSAAPQSVVCSLAGCRRAEFVRIECPNCLQHYCLKHRHPELHACQS